jgi:hypothetical protein
MAAEANGESETPDSAMRIQVAPENPPTATAAPEATLEAPLEAMSETEAAQLTNQPPGAVAKAGPDQTPGEMPFPYLAPGEELTQTPGEAPPPSLKQPPATLTQPNGAQQDQSRLPAPTSRGMIAEAQPSTGEPSAYALAPAAETPSSTISFPALRTIEILLALVAIVSGLAAFLVQRIGNR